MTVLSDVLVPTLEVSQPPAERLRSSDTPSSRAAPSPSRGPLQRLGVAISVIGVLLCGFVAFELLVSDLLAQRSQDLLRPRLAERFLIERSISVTEADSSGGVQDSRSAFAESNAEFGEVETSGPEVDETEMIERGVEQPQLGDPIALLSIPKLGVEQVVVAGSGQAQLNTGPGHYRASPLPGRLGNVVIAGRRATYDAPFEELGRLVRGDRLSLSTGVGSFDYRVSDVGIVEVGEPDVVGDDGTNKLTLVTANNPLDAGGRLVVVARLSGSGNAPSAETTEENLERLALPESELGLARDSTAWAPALVFGQLLLGLWLAHRYVRTRWTPASRWLVGSPLVVAVLVAFYESVSRLLPATL